MSFKERMLDVMTGGALHKLMQEMALRGSPDWTLEQVQRYVPPHLWGELPRYFDQEGRHLRSSSVVLLDEEPDPDELLGEAGAGFDRESLLGGSPEAVPLSVLVATFHARLAEIREALSLAEVVWHDEPRTDLMSPQTDERQIDTTDGLHSAPAADGRSATTQQQVPVEVEANFKCVVCERGVRGVPIVFNGRPLCLGCANEFGVR
jgi:hypothetical protein